MIWGSPGRRILPSQRALRGRVLTSASLMANMPAFAHAVEHVVRPHPELGVGAHFCLTSGRRYATRPKCGLLVDRNGEFRTASSGCGDWSARSAARRLWTRYAASCGPSGADPLGRDRARSRQWASARPHAAGIWDHVVQIARALGAAVRIPGPAPAPGRTWQRLAARLLGGGRVQGGRLARLRRQFGATASTHPTNSRETHENLHTTGACWGVAESGRLGLSVLGEIAASWPTGSTKYSLIVSGLGRRRGAELQPGGPGSFCVRPGGSGSWRPCWIPACRYGSATLGGVDSRRRGKVLLTLRVRKRVTLERDESIGARLYDMAIGDGKHLSWAMDFAPGRSGRYSVCTLGRGAGDAAWERRWPSCSWR